MDGDMSTYAVGVHFGGCLLVGDLDGPETDEQRDDIVKLTTGVSFAKVAVPGREGD